MKTTIAAALKVADNPGDFDRRQIRDAFAVLHHSAEAGVRAHRIAAQVIWDWFGRNPTQTPPAPPSVEGMESEARQQPDNFARLWIYPNRGGKLLLSVIHKRSRINYEPDAFAVTFKWYLAGDEINRNFARLILDGYSLTNPPL